MPKQLVIETIILEPKTKSQLEAIKAIASALKVPFKNAKHSSYNPEFVNNINESRKQVREGKTVKINLDNIRKE